MAGIRTLTAEAARALVRGYMDDTNLVGAPGRVFVDMKRERCVVDVAVGGHHYAVMIQFEGELYEMSDNSEIEGPRVDPTKGLLEVL